MSNNKLKEVAQAVGAKQSFISGRWTLLQNGVKYWYSYTPQQKSTPPSFTLGMPLIAKGEFSLVAETPEDRKAKTLGYSNELQTGDAEFDSRFYIISDTPEFAKAFF